MSSGPRKVAIVTGGAQGIGFATATALLEQHHQVVLSDIEEDRLKDALTRLPPGSETHTATIVADATQARDAEQLVDGCLARFGRLDVLVNNVGGRGEPPGLEADAVAAERDLDLCLTTTFLCSRAAVPALTSSGGGAIINISSSAGRYYSDMAGVPYCAGKAGVLALTRALAAELAPHGIRCNCVAPGNTLTEQGQRDWDALPRPTRDMIEAAIPLGRLAQPRDLADVIAFLASDQARYVTGVSIDVNGGQHMS